MEQHPEHPQETDIRLADIRLTGIWAWCPSAFHPYIRLARLDRPAGWWLLVLPGWWIFASLADSLQAALWMMLLFMAGAIITRAAGCVVNDLWDRDIDKQVTRTASRPLASGQISPLSAVIFLIFLGIGGLIILFQLPVYAWAVGIASAPLVILYPLAKRITNWPQAVLGLTFSWAVPTAYASLFSAPPTPAIALIYAGTVFWVIGYDTIYAVQDQQDDIAAGVKSSALALGPLVPVAVGIFYLVASGFWLAGFSLAVGGGLWLAGWLAATLHLGWQVIRIRKGVPAGRIFVSNRDCGLLLTAGFLIQLALS